MDPANKALQRMAQAYSGEKPVTTGHICGVSYPKGGSLGNHTDADKPLYTLSLALGEACDFTVGKKTIRPRRVRLQRLA